MACTCQKVCIAFRDQLDAVHPDRDRATDGCCASAQHTQQNPTSGHEAGIAWDADADLEPGNPGRMAEITDHLAAMMLAGLLPELDYIIYNRRIFNPEIAPWWRPYHGSNAHVSHAHLEFYWTHRNATPDFGLDGQGDEWMPQAQADRIEAKVNRLLVITAKRGVLARMNARLKSLVRRETARTERNARGR